MESGDGLPFDQDGVCDDIVVHERRDEFEITVR